MLLVDFMVELNLYWVFVPLLSIHMNVTIVLLIHGWTISYVLVTYLILFPTYTLFILDRTPLITFLCSFMFLPLVCLSLLPIQ